MQTDVTDASAPVPAPAAATAQLRTVLVCDLADSTALVELLGDRRGAELMRRHDRIARDLLLAHRGREIDKTDGFLALFERPIQALAFALDYQRALRDLEAAPGRPLQARVGIHVGEVQVWDNPEADIAQGAKRVEVEGFAKPVAARLMSVARPGQILLSGVAFNLAQRAADELGERAQRVRWLTHGRYHFKGVAQPMVVHEAGEVGVAPLLAPPSAAKVRRAQPWYRRPAMVAVEACLVLAGAAALLFMVLRPAPAVAFAERDWVVVGNLRNLTSEPLFDDALDAAFRIGLEQSPYVNVVPSLQLQDALRRMQRPADEPLDRDTAVELAMREGARAVILPTITEVGGRVRVSAEVIDPTSGVTVYGESADGRGAEAALPAMDEVLHALRKRLGESLASIEASGAPLQQVTTGNLEALRAFSLGIRAAEQGQASQAYAMFERALELDPSFAAAHAKMAAFYYQTGNRAEAWRHVQAAVASRERLSARDQLYVDAYLAFFATPREMRERWTQLARLYPDFVTGQQNLGMVTWMFDNDFSAALPMFEQVAESRHPFRGIGMESAAALLIGLGRYAEASRWLADAKSLGAPRVFHAAVDLPLAQRDYVAARAVLEEPHDPRFLTGALERSLRVAAVALEEGRPAEALAALRAQLESVRALPEALARLQLSIAAVQQWSGAPFAAPLGELVEREAARLREAASTRDESPVNHLSIAAVIAARGGELALARRAIDAARPSAAGSGFPGREAWLAMAEAELALAGGEPTAAADRAASAAGFGLFYGDVLSGRIALARGDLEDARAAVVRTEQQRGRMLSEYVALHAALLLNVASASALRVDAAALAREQGRAAVAMELLAPLRAAWKDADRDVLPVQRLRRLLDQEDHQAHLPFQLRPDRVAVLLDGLLAGQPAHGRHLRWIHLDAERMQDQRRIAEELLAEAVVAG